MIVNKNNDDIATTAQNNLRVYRKMCIRDRYICIDIRHISYVVTVDFPAFGRSWLDRTLTMDLAYNQLWPGLLYPDHGGLFSKLVKLEIQLGWNQGNLI